MTSRLAGVAVTLMLCACAPGVSPATDLTITIRPKSIFDDGKDVAFLQFSASDAKGQAGKGKVTVSSSAGSLREPVSVTLDADGLASSEFTCGFSEDPDCTGTVDLMAKWSQGGATAEAEGVVTIKTDPLRDACAPAKLRQLKGITSAMADIRLAVSPDFQETQALTALGNEVGVAFYNDKLKIGGFALAETPLGADALEEEALIRAKIETTGVVSNPLVQGFTTWDGYAAARATYDLEGSDDIKTRLSAIAVAVSKPELIGGLAGFAGAAGPFKLTMTLVRRAGTTVIAMAIANESGDLIAKQAAMDDAIGGTALARVADSNVVQCQKLIVTSDQKIDFLWVVDDSGSMGSSQQAVSVAGNLFGQRLALAGLNWRAAGSTTGYYPTSFSGSFRDWTSDANTMKGWFDNSSSTSFGTNGDGTECGFDGLKSFTERLTRSGSGVAPGLVRSDAQFHVIFMSDTMDQCGMMPDQLLGYLAGKYPNQKVVLHGIVCPEGLNCGDSDEENGHYHQVIRKSGGVLGSIKIFNPMPPVAPTIAAQQSTTINAIVGTAIGAAGRPLSNPPTASSIRVAATATRGTCELASIPHDRTNGWDIDPTTGKIVFYGNCIPTSSATVMVQYQSWVDNTP